MSKLNKYGAKKSESNLLAVGFDAASESKRAAMIEKDANRQKLEALMREKHQKLADALKVSNERYRLVLDEYFASSVKLPLPLHVLKRGLSDLGLSPSKRSYVFLKLSLPVGFTNVVACIAGCQLFETISRYSATGAFGQ